MNLKELLHNKIKEGRITRDELRNFGRDIETRRNMLGYDLATVDRKLRELTEEGIIKPEMRNGYIIAYNLSGSTLQAQIKPPVARGAILSQQVLNDVIEANNLLKAIIRRGGLNFNDLTLINKALGKDLNYKKWVIKEYEK